MKILQVTPGYYPLRGGVERHVQGLSETLVGLGHTVTVATLAPPAVRPGTAVIGGVRVLRFPAGGPRGYRLPRSLWRYLRRAPARFDVVHAHNAHALPLLLAVVATRGRCVISPYYHGRAHSGPATLLHRAYDPLARRVLPRAAAVICLSHAEAAAATRGLGLPAARITVIPSGLTLPPPAEAPQQSKIQNPKSKISGGAPWLLSVGRLERYKQVDRALAALAHLPAPYRLAIVGAGPERDRLERRAARLGLAGRFGFVGAAGDEDLRAWYGRARVVLALSTAESFGLTVLEALAAGSAVVATAIPAHREFAAAFPGAVFLVPVDATGEEIAGAVAAATVAGSPPPFDLSRFAWPAIARATLDVYARVAAGRGG